MDRVELLQRQGQAAEAVAQLREEGIDVTVDELLPDVRALERQARKSLPRAQQTSR